MTTETGRRAALSCAMLAALSLAGCATGTPDRQMATADRLADAGAICRDTMGLSAANAPYDLCVRSLLQNAVAQDHAILEMPDAMPESDTQKSCARFGLALGSDAFQSCAGNLEASLFEATDATAR